MLSSSNTDITTSHKTIDTATSEITSNPTYSETPPPPYSPPDPSSADFYTLAAATGSTINDIYVQKMVAYMLSVGPDIEPDSYSDSSPEGERDEKPVKPSKQGKPKSKKMLKREKLDPEFEPYAIPHRKHPVLTGIHARWRGRMYDVRCFFANWRGFESRR